MHVKRLGGPLAVGILLLWFLLSVMVQLDLSKKVHLVSLQQLIPFLRTGSSSSNSVENVMAWHLMLQDCLTNHSYMFDSLRKPHAIDLFASALSCHVFSGLFVGTEDYWPRNNSHSTI